MVNRQLLVKVGFTQNESAVYIALLQLGKGSASAIGNLIGMDRNIVRRTCEALENYGLVHMRKDGNAFTYVAEPPEKIQYVIEDRKMKLQEQQKTFDRSIGELKSIVDPTLKLPSVSYYEGMGEIKDIYEDMISTGEDIYCWTDSKLMYSLMKDYIPEFVEKRVNAGIKSYAIMPESSINLDYSNEKEHFRECKLKSNLNLNGQIRIYGNKVAIMTFTPNKPIGFIFEGGLLSDLFRSVFQSAWED